MFFDGCAGQCIGHIGKTVPNCMAREVANCDVEMRCFFEVQKQAKVNSDSKHSSGFTSDPMKWVLDQISIFEVTSAFWPIIWQKNGCMPRRPRLLLG